ncbi:DUF421 domain-containing protein [Flavobacterium sp. NST-5]|uniref:DUF421 domain-containing protein n=1 Tax=Flavobacterium ichthyis TaxID=2698827 RepID=A0ABW9Z569_9FLAO|nr:YetF domain-containing protein [Flavobacterium ichthyis]NBL63985.1 DUF421 domain-containing protein [Flavobacterium ichthyis]
MQNLFFESWENIFRIVICSAIGYLALFLFIRISGKRTLSKFSAFDFVVSVSLGSTLSWMILDQVRILEGGIALIVIIVLQYLLAFISQKSKSLERLINSSPTLLFYDGKFLKHKLKTEFITQEEIIAEVRKNGIEDLNEVRAIILEIDGNISIIKKSEKVGRSTLVKIANT